MILASSIIRDEFGKIDELNMDIVEDVSEIDGICEELNSKTTHPGIRGVNDFIRFEIWIQNQTDTTAQLYFFKEFNGESKCIQTSYEVKKYKKKEGQIIRFPIEKIKK
jgi:hypothetical protein